MRIPLRPFVDGASDQLLARSGFTGQQDGRVRGRDFRDARQHGSQSRGCTNNLLKHRRLSDLFFQCEILIVQAVFQARDFLERILQRDSGLHLFGDIHRRSEKFLECTGLIPDWMADCVLVLDRSISKNNAVLCFIFESLGYASFEALADALPVFWMNSVEPEVRAPDLLIRVNGVDPKHLRRQTDAAGCEIELPAAYMA